MDSQEVISPMIPSKQTGSAASMVCSLTRCRRVDEQHARAAGCRRLWLATTNDNLPAIAFYSKRGWREVAIHRGAVAAARRLKPEIPEFGANGVRKQDEIEFELRFDGPAPNHGIQPTAFCRG